MLIRFFMWLDGVFPLQCPNCSRWSPKKGFVYAEHRVAGEVLICRQCHDLYYTDGV